MEVEIVNEKKLFPEKKLSKKGLMEFLDKKGFYIVLILCIAVVGVTAVFLTMQNNAPMEDNNPEAENVIPEEDTDSILGVQDPGPVQSSITTADEDQEDVAANAVPDVDEEENVAAKDPVQKDDGNKGTEEKKEDNKNSEPAKNPSGSSTSTSAKSEEEVKETFVMPVFGQISYEFAQDKLAYSKTMDDWRKHEGVDIAADRGTPVKAVAAGVVSEIKNDPRFGITVIIDHQNGIKTVYANLASDEMVTPNQRVEKSEVIGSIGNTAAFESAEQSHLHFEVWKDNKPVDPTAYLPENTEDK